MCIPEPYWINPQQADFEIQITKFDNLIFYTKEKLPMFLGGGGQPPDEATIILSDKNKFIIKEAAENSFKLKKKVSQDMIKELPIIAKLNINLTLRQAYMRAHTSQHILSAIIKKKYDIDTTKAVLEEDEAKLFLKEKLSLDQLSDLFTEFYSIMHKNLAIKSRIIKKGDNFDLEGKFVDLNKIRGGIPTEEKCIRLVEVEGVDLNTCGGTHLSYSSDVLALLFTDHKKDHVSFKVGFKAIQEFEKNQEFIINLTNKIMLPLAKARERTTEIVDSYPMLQKMSFDLSKTMLRTIFSSIKAIFDEGNNEKKVFSLGDFASETITKQNLPVKAWMHNGILIIVMNLSFLNRTAFVASVIEFPYPTVIIAELEKSNLICQTNTDLLSAKVFLEKFKEKANVKGGGSEKQIQCSVKNVDNLYQIIQSLIEET